MLTKVSRVRTSAIIIRAAERVGGRGGGTQDKCKKWGPTKWVVCGGSGGTPPGNFEILHALKCVLGAPEAFLSCTHTVHMHRPIYLQFAVFD